MQPHPDAERATRRMPFEQLRALVVALVEPDPDADPAVEFDTRPTTCLPHARVSTLDQLIAALPRYDADREPRFSRGSSPHLSRAPDPSVRSGAYTARPAPEPPRSAAPAPPAPPTRPRRPGTGRGSQRR